MLAAGEGDTAARRELVEAFLPMIASVARLYRGAAAVDRGELIQEGVVGLLRALERYDLGRDTPFWAYAGWWVRRAMQQLVAELGRPVVLSDRALRQLARIKHAHREHRQAHGRDPSTAELEATTGLTRMQIDSLRSVERTPRALEGRVDAGSEGAAVLGDLVADPLAEQEYEAVVGRLERESLRTVPAQLCEREREILKAHYGLDRPAQTLRQIGECLGLSAERVRQIEERALDKLRASASPASA